MSMETIMPIAYQNAQLMLSRKLDQANQREKYLRDQRHAIKTELENIFKHSTQQVFKWEKWNSSWPMDI